MPFDFTGIGPTVITSGAAFSGGTTQSGTAVFSFSYTGSSLVTFDGTDINIGTGTWQGSLVLSTLSSVAFTGLSISGQSAFSTSTSSQNPGGSFIVYQFSGNGPGSITGYNATCYCAGTMIAAPGGARAVETLRPGDVISKAGGGETTVRWLGRQSIATRFCKPEKVNPICISANALGEGVPARDLYVSPDHAIAIDGMLVNANTLRNGGTIYQVREMPLDGFTYYHVETDAHELLLAEGCPAESYLDVPSRAAFDNAAEYEAAPIISEMDMPRISSRRLLPASLKARLGIIDPSPEFARLSSSYLSVA